MEKLNVGDNAPVFCLQDHSKTERCLKEFAGKKVVVYFYPKDNTPGCTLEAMDFSALKGEFERSNTIILGISRDSCDSHQKFIDKKGLTITLLSDTDSDIQKKYGVWRKKSFMGKEFVGTIRSTFLLDRNGKIARIWDPVNVKGHAEDVLSEVKNLG